MNTKFTDQELIDLNKSGLSVQEIAAKLDVSQGTIFRRQKLLNLKTINRHNAELCKFSDEQLVALHEKGMINKRIAEELNASASTVSTRLRRIGLPANPGPGKAHKITDEQLRAAHAEELSDTEIGEKFGLHPATVSKRRKRIDLAKNSRTPRTNTPKPVSHIRITGSGIKDKPPAKSKSKTARSKDEQKDYERKIAYIKTNWLRFRRERLAQIQAEEEAQRKADFDAYQDKAEKTTAT